MTFKDLPGTSRLLTIFSLTTQRKGAGLRATTPAIFDAIEKVITEAREYTRSKVCLPVLGSGHGGLPHEVAFMSMVLALAQHLPQGGSVKIRTVKIVIFQKSKGAKPALSDKMIKRCLAWAGISMEESVQRPGADEGETATRSAA